MLNGLYFTAVVFLFLLFFQCLISEFTEWISAKLGYIFTYDCYLTKIGPNYPGHLPPMGWGKKTLFWGSTLNFDRTYLCKLVNLEGLSFMPPPKLNFGPETAEKGWQVFVHTQIFASGDTATVAAWKLYNKQQANFNTLCSGTSLQSRTTECLAGSRRALHWSCHQPNADCSLGLQTLLSAEV